MTRSSEPAGESGSAPEAQHAALVRHYMQNYPDTHVNELVELFATKAENAAIATLVAAQSRPHTRADLYQVLMAATVAEIAHVGW